MCISMDSSSSHPPDNPKPKRLRTLACDVKFNKGNTLLHQFVLDNSDPNESGSGNYINAVLLSMSDAPASVVNALNGDGYNALHLAVSKHNLLMVEKLLSCLANIDVNARDGYRGDTALHSAASERHLSIGQVLLDNGATVDVDNGVDGTALCIAASFGHLDLVKLLVGKGSDLNYRGKWGTPLSYAAGSGSLEAVEFLVSSGAEINLRNEKNALCSAVESEQLAIAEFLLSKGADVNIKDNEDETPLHLAAQSYSLKFVEYLLRNGADVNAENGVLEETPLHHAARRKLSWVGFSLDLDHYAVDIVEYLLDQGADIDAENVENETPLHYAVRERNLVLEDFADISSVWKRHDAVRQGNLKIVKLLLNQGADLRSIDEEGRTPLHRAVDEECSKIAEFLADSGEGPHADCGWDPYLDAEYRCCAKIIRTLLDRGADVNAEDEKGETPLDLARNQSCIDTVRILEKE